MYIVNQSTNWLFLIFLSCLPMHFHFPGWTGFVNHRGVSMTGVAIGYPVPEIVHHFIPHTASTCKPLRVADTCKTASVPSYPLPLRKIADTLSSSEWHLLASWMYLFQLRPNSVNKSDCTTFNYRMCTSYATPLPLQSYSARPKSWIRQER